MTTSLISIIIGLALLLALMTVAVLLLRKRASNRAAAEAAALAAAEPDRTGPKYRHAGLPVAPGTTGSEAAARPAGGRRIASGPTPDELRATARRDEEDRRRNQDNSMGAATVFAVTQLPVSEPPRDDLDGHSNESHDSSYRYDSTPSHDYSSSSDSSSSHDPSSFSDSGSSGGASGGGGGSSN